MKKTFLVTICALAAVALALAIIPTTRDEIHWRWATTANTIRSYQGYVATHPYGKFVQQAETKATALRGDQAPYDAALRTGTEASLRAFLADYPGHTNEAAAQHALKDITEKRAFERGMKDKTIAAMSGFIKNYPKTAFVEKAVAEIWRSLSEQFPEKEFTSSTTLESIMNALPAAIKAGRPLVVAFAPRRVQGHGSWSWNTSFRELAGQPVTLEEMSPSIRKPNGDVYSFGYGSH
jgi:hypothetical protein